MAPEDFDDPAPIVERRENGVRAAERDNKEKGPKSKFRRHREAKGEGRKIKASLGCPLFNCS